MCVVGTALGTANLGRNGGPRPNLISYLLCSVQRTTAGALLLGVSARAVELL